MSLWHKGGFHTQTTRAPLCLWVVLQGAAGLHGELVHPPVHDVLLQDQGTAALSGVETVGPVHVQDGGEIIRVLQSVMKYFTNN